MPNNKHITLELNDVLRADIAYFSKMTGMKGTTSRNDPPIAPARTEEYATEIIEAYLAEKRLAYVRLGMGHKESIEAFLTRQAGKVA